MGNTLSGAPQHPMPRGVETGGETLVPTPSSPNAISANAESVQGPTDEGGAHVSRHKSWRRKSLTKFASLPSLRKKSSASSLNNNSGAPCSTEDPVHSTPSRRRWRSFRRTQDRPISTITDSEVPTIVEEAALEAPPHASISKGKESEAKIPHQEITPQQHVETLAQEGLQSCSDPQSAGGNSQSTEHPLDVDGRSTQPENLPAPIPLSSIEPATMTSEDEEDEGRVLEQRFNPALVDALGSWLSGRARENTAQAVDNAHVAAESQSQRSGTITPTQSPSIGPSGLRTSEPFDSSQGRTIDGSGTSPPLTPLPADRGRFGRSSSPAPDRRTLPPAGTGTGTLVVVQGVVHTTDVRHNLARHPQVPPASTRIPVSSPATPVRRLSSRRSHSRSPTRASTPQPPSSPRRGRFLSLTNSLRSRSRSGASSSRATIGSSSLGHNVSSSHTPSTAEMAAELEGLNGLPDSENAASSPPYLSSYIPFGPPFEESPRSDPHVAGINGRTLHEESPGRTRNEGIQTSNVQRGAPTNDVGDGDEESDLSASSIEVLGTLLSVATAATAASLVTGTTDPLFSSGLAGPNAPSGSPSSPPRGIPTANHETPLAPGRGTSLRAASEVENNIDTEAAANTRMRAAWESLRDRFARARGRRGSAMGLEGREDPREQMLREMARAFNTGLGLDSDDDVRERLEPVQRDRSERAAGGSTITPVFPPQNEPPSPDGVNVTAPEAVGVDAGAEGSFERFLHNLQIDLRTALTEDYAARRARAQARDSRSAPDTSRSNAPEVQATGSTRNPTTRDTSAEQNINGEAGASGETLALPNTPRPATLDLPPLRGSLETLMEGQDGNHPPPQAHGITGQPGAGVNWWRLYRFPPMQLAPRPGGPMPGDPPGPQLRAFDRLPMSRDDGRQSPPQTSALPNVGAPTEQHVVPVIVVGLQSVPVTGGAPHYHNYHDFDPPPPSEVQVSGPGPGPLSDNPTRERPWPLRAVSRAFGRSNRTGDAESSNESDGPASRERMDAPSSREERRGGRTYLIFVIGGYYPPNHSIVTGADDMNSFEALWELAELLGQVKPPVASKEDIEKSGLEIIKASRLSAYEKDGKVASNTVERCLICLDNYENEDDLRLLSCRHIFHKQCVDKWLEQGRNNCPACRTKGVRTSGDEPSDSLPTSDI